MSLSLRPWILATRPRTLPAAFAPVLVGSAAAYAAGSFVPQAAWVCLVFALLMQVTTNFANDYFDHVNGVDTEARVGPTRAVASGQIAPKVMLAATLTVTAAAFCVGLLLIRYGGCWLLPIGIFSAICAIAYTGGPYPLGYNGLGDVFAFLFFGPIAVGGSYYVQANQLGGNALWAGAGVGLLVANILVVNNYRDAQTDAVSGKRTLIVRFGRRFGWWQYVLSFAAAMAIPLILWLGYGAPVWVLLVWLVLPLGITMARTLCGGGEPAARAPEAVITTQGATAAERRLPQEHDHMASAAVAQGARLNGLLGKTALLAMLYAILLSVGFLLGV